MACCVKCTIVTGIISVEGCGKGWCACGLEKRAGTGQDKSHGTGSIVPALAENAMTGHPQFRRGKEKPPRKGGPPAEAETDSNGRISFLTVHPPFIS
jgi:hypothetical protein